MNAGYVMDLSREVIWTIVKVAAPLLIISLIIGLIVSVLQTITSIQEQTLTFVPKFLAIMLVLVLFGGWMLNTVSELLKDIMAQIPTIIR
ncbi:MAG: flagellar biosynthesis protein FliQ [Lachnospiraceae bacterium]|jgi:flagellar biosynthetic protein FliQ|nr:flagellar biosynthesis protein FliQ [Lachnospiraceae bacterium]MCI8779398.1 flagellar biosynthesis protein FliQ [Lachnospiraceae bacterium]